MARPKKAIAAPAAKRKYKLPSKSVVDPIRYEDEGTSKKLHLVTLIMSDGAEFTINVYADAITESLLSRMEQKFPGVEGFIF